jgi:hypothetical protein
MTSYEKRNSPLFEDLLRSLRKRDVARLSKFFPLVNASTWLDVHGKRRKLRDLDELRSEITEQIVSPLYKWQGVNVRDEDKPELHAKENLFCRVELLLRNLRKMEADDGAEESHFEKALSIFHRDWKKLVPGVIEPFAWALDRSTEGTGRIIQAQLSETEAHIQKLDGLLDDMASGVVLIEAEGPTHPVNTRMGLIEDRERLKMKARRAASWKRKLLKVIDQIEVQMMPYLKFARGKRGRHPHPYNVLVYHLIRKITLRKISWKQREAGLEPYIFRKDGRYRLETDWQLVIFLLLEIHIGVVRIHELDGFIRVFAKRSIAVAMRALKTDLWNRYKNFRPLHAQPGLRRRPDETGFKKLVITSKGTLRIIAL